MAIMFCRYHPERIALAQCHRCGDPVCDSCVVNLQARPFCVRCSDFIGQGEAVHPKRYPFLAAFLSLIFPGMGQCYNGQYLKGILILAGAVLAVPWLYGIYDAYQTAAALNKGTVPFSESFLSFQACLLLAVILAALPFLVISAVRHYREMMHVSAPAATPAAMLKKISSALEAYFDDHGVYPQSSSALYFSTPPYLDDLYCDAERGGFQITCLLTEDGYLVTAKLAGPDQVDGPGYSVATGGVLTAGDQFEAPERAIERKGTRR